MRAALGALAILALGPLPGLALDLGDGLVRLRHESYDRHVGPAPSRSALDALAPDDVETWIVAFEPPADRELRDAITRRGGRIVGYVPSNAFLVRGEARVAAALRSAPAITRVDRYRSEWKISPDIGRVRYQGAVRASEPDRRWLRLEVFEGEDPEKVAAAARAAGAEVLGVIDAEGVRRVVVFVEPDAVPGLARLSEVEWIEEVPEVQLRNDVVRWVIQSNIADYEPLHDRGLLGEGQIIGHIDALIQTASCYFDDPSNPIGPDHRKIVAMRGNMSTLEWRHGTHTAGTLAADAWPTDGSTANRGMAPLARISHQSFLDLQWIELTGEPSNVGGFMADAHADGARIHSNSWGDPNNSRSYTSLCRDIDVFARNHESDLVVFAVANGGIVTSPENAKNILSVGATFRPSDQDTISHGGVGPTADGRRRPEVFAPGRSTLSASTGTCGETTLSGTSMACPAVAGGAALVREYLVRGFHPTGRPWDAHAMTPTGALLKAIVINSSVDLDRVPNYPSDAEGWGRILLDDALYFPGDSRRLWLRDVTNANGLSTGEVDTHVLRVVDPSEPLKITMTFTDEPASIAADPAPVNDLDLEVDGPDGLFLGNEFDVVNGVSRTGGSADPLNNAERVIVAAPTPGVWTVRVRGGDVPVGPQGYAIAANGGLFPAMERTELAPGESGSPPTIPNASRAVPGDWGLGPMSPNPFRRSTSVRYVVPETAVVRVAVYDVRGALVRMLVDRTVSAGEFRASWDGRDESGRRATPGIYFLRLTAPGFDRSLKGVLLR